MIENAVEICVLREPIPVQAQPPAEPGTHIMAAPLTKEHFVLISCPKVSPQTSVFQEAGSSEAKEQLLHFSAP